ncbi:hypothetical protein [Cupriavidus metallidurans]|uniref:hypothetical protein n=1 Tax=Cupriavidus metallidurans TaxID=119219 RepID=UPI000CE04B40|nr:hypothetical protein [Cupriavidus metallidurans]AVA38260.1 hypothetical protein C3Z06_32155 [Cupriavidus metallidurans]
MKYPRLANALQDAGMILSLLASAGLIFAAMFEGMAAGHMTYGTLILLGGICLVACATQLSKVRHQPTDEGRPTLRRVK